MRLVAFPFHDWRKGQQEGFRTRDLHVLEWLARNPQVESLLVVDRPVSLAERLLRRRPWSVAGEAVAEAAFGRQRARLTRVGERVLVLDQAAPDIIGPIRHRRGWWFDAFVSGRTLDAIAWAAGEHAVDGVIAWLPAVWPALESLHSPFVFDSLDNWLIHPAFEPWRERSREAYAQITPAARSVFVSAPASRAVLAPWRADIEVVPNGVDTETFQEPRSRPTDLPRGPVVGYIGKLASRIDATLVAEVATARPSMAFAFLGPELEPSAIAPMRHVPNVHLLGDRHYDDIPAYVQHFDVCWIPHSVGTGETGGDPIKLYEYWAAGRQVVSTRIDGMEAWTDRVALVDDAAQAAEAIDGLLAGTRMLPTPTVPSDRTWQAITARLVEPLTTRA